MNTFSHLILGIESSCDDTSVAFVRDNKLIDCIVVSSASIQAKFGGIVPELAAREHERLFLPLIKELFSRSGLYWHEVTHVAYTEKPGLVGSLLVGQIFAKSLALVHNKPLLPIDHVHGHIFSVGLTNNISFPALALVVSGKTTAFYFVKGFDDVELLENTSDNALGEVYDKVARELGFPYPGGKYVDELFNAHRKVDNLLNTSHNPAQRLSYSGILSAVCRLIKYANTRQIDNKEEYVATVFQKWVIDGLLKKTKYWSVKCETKNLFISGGVAANKYLREEFKKLDMNVLLVDDKFAGDNAAMIAFLASYLLDK